MDTYPSSLNPLFDLSGRVAVITGGAGLLGQKHAEGIALAGGIPVLIDVSPKTESVASALTERFERPVLAHRADITRQEQVAAVVERIEAEVGNIRILVNNAANNRQLGASGDSSTRFENFPLEVWNQDLFVGLTGSFVCSQVIGKRMAERREGVIVNIASDLAVIAPDQRIYRLDGVPDEQQPAKPVSYSVVKTGLIGLTRYLATYWAADGVRVNALSPGGVRTDQPDEFVQRLTRLIPLGRMAEVDEYVGSLLFLCSDASSYMTGQNLVVDGGRTTW